MYDVSDDHQGSLCNRNGSVPSCSSQTINRGIFFYQFIYFSIHFLFKKSSAFNDLADCPAPAVLLMRKLLILPPKSLWQVAHTFISHFRSILGDAVPRQVQGLSSNNILHIRTSLKKSIRVPFAELYRQVWLKLNSILPRQLWVMTANAVRLELSLSEGHPIPTLTQDHLTFDPLHVLRCDTRVFRYKSAVDLFRI